MQKPKTLSERLLLSFRICFVALLLVLTVNAAFFPLLNQPLGNGKTLLYVLGIVLLGLATVFGAHMFARYLPRQTRVVSGKPYHVLLVVMLPLLLFQVYVIKAAATSYGWDVGAIVSGAFDPAPYTHYFSAYRNNLFPMFLSRFFVNILVRPAMALFQIDVWTGLSSISVLLADVAIVLVFSAVKQALGNRAAIFTLVFLVPLIGLQPWILVPYTDAYSLPITAGLLFLYVRWSTCSEKRGKIIYATLMGLVTGLGALVKMHTVIFFIAIVLIHFLVTQRPKAKGQRPRANGQGPKAKGQGPRAKGQGPRAKGQGPRASITSCLL